MSTIIEVYRSLLKFSGSEADDQGFISSVIGEDRQPITIDGLRLVLPMHEQLRHFNPKEKVLFHPLAENILTDESNVIKKFRDIINIRLNYTTGIVVQSLLRLVASPELHKRLTPEQTELLLKIKDADDKTVTEFINHMLTAMKAKPDRIFTNIYLKKGGALRGEKFARLGVVSFPFYESISELKCRQKDKHTYKQIFEFLFMNIDKKEEYNFGSNSRIAPNLDALMNTAVVLASRLNDVIELYSDYIENSNELKFDSDWYGYFQNLGELLPEIRKVPAHVSQDNTVSPIATVQEIPEVQSVVPMPTTVAPIPLQQYQVPVQQPNTVVKTERGIDFSSVLRSNPALAYAPNPLAGAIQAQQMQQAQQPIVLNQYGQPVQLPPPGVPYQPYQTPYQQVVQPQVIYQQPLMQSQQPQVVYVDQYNRPIMQ